MYLPSCLSHGVPAPGQACICTGSMWWCSALPALPIICWWRPFPAPVAATGTGVWGHLGAPREVLPRPQVRSWAQKPSALALQSPAHPAGCHPSVMQALGQSAPSNCCLIWPSTWWSLSCPHIGNNSVCSAPTILHSHSKVGGGKDRSLSLLHFVSSGFWTWLVVEWYLNIISTPSALKPLYRFKMDTNPGLAPANSFWIRFSNTFCQNQNILPLASSSQKEKVDFLSPSPWCSLCQTEENP